MRTDQATSMPRIHHQAKISCRAIRWPLRVNVAASACWREKERTTRIPPNASVACESISWRVLRMSRKIGRIRPIQVRCVSQTVGSSASDPEQQPPVDKRQDDQAAEQLDDRPPGVVEHGEDQVGDAAGVFAEDRRDAAGFQLVHAMQRQSHGMVEDLLPHRHLHALGHARGLPAAPEAEQFRRRRQHHHADRDDRQQVPAIGAADESSAAARAGSGCSRSTLSKTILVPYSGTSPSSVEMPSASKTRMSVQR